MSTPLRHYAEDHAFLLAAAAEAAGLTDPVAIDFDSFTFPLVTNAVRGRFVPLAGAFVRDWDRSWPKYWPGVKFGGRLYTIEGIRFVRVFARLDDHTAEAGYDFFAVARADYDRLYRIARRLARRSQPQDPPPVLAAETLDTIRQNTTGFLDPKNLTRIRALGGRPKRGLLFTGPPGNGKTSACRWVLQQCTRQGFQTKHVSPDDYRAARNSCNPAAAVRELFRVTGRGVVFFDDMDMALRDRSATEQPEDQAVFLGALDGIEVNEGVVYVFTTNLPLDRIDPAFKRPGRLDLVIPFPKPDARLREALVGRWHADIRAGVDLATVLTDTAGYSFAEVEELKNLLVLRYIDAGEWDWGWAVRQFAVNRHDLAAERSAGLGFAAAAAAANGNGRH